MRQNAGYLEFEENIATIRRKKREKRIFYGILISVGIGVFCGILYVLSEKNCKKDGGELIFEFSQKRILCVQRY